MLQYKFEIVVKDADLFESVGVQLVKDIEFRGRHDRYLYLQWYLHCKHQSSQTEIIYLVFQPGKCTTCEQSSSTIGFQVSIPELSTPDIIWPPEIFTLD